MRENRVYVNGDIIKYVKKRYHKLSVLQLLLLIIFALIVLYIVIWPILMRPRKSFAEKTQNDLNKYVRNIDQIAKEVVLLTNMATSTLEEGYYKQEQIQDFAQGEINTVLKKLIESFSAYQIELISISNEPVVKTNDFFKSNVNMIIQGKYNSIGEHLFFLKELPLLYQFIKVDIEPIENGRYINMELSMEIYFL
ncbi:hypothetical protein ACFL2K_03035 [Candidatus Margulisiibacteriota bacterium]